MKSRLFLGGGGGKVFFGGSPGFVFWGGGAGGGRKRGRGGSEGTPKPILPPFFSPRPEEGKEKKSPSSMVAQRTSRKDNASPTFSPRIIQKKKRGGGCSPKGKKARSNRSRLFTPCLTSLLLAEERGKKKPIYGQCRRRGHEFNQAGRNAGMHFPRAEKEGKKNDNPQSV